MAEEDDDQKTEDASSKRLQDARDEGQIAVSREMATWFSLVAALMVVGWFGPNLGEKLQLSLRVFLERPEQLSIEDGGLQDILVGIFSVVAMPAALVFGVLFAFAVLGTMAQTGFYVNPAKIKLDFEKVFSLQGFKNVFSMNAVAELLKGFVKLVVLGYIAYRILTPVVGGFASLVDVPVLQGLSVLHTETVHLTLVLMIAITIIAVADILYVRYTYYKGLRMTKQEVKDEHKQMEGDPMIKGRLRRLRLEKARRRMMANVPSADVVVTNPTHFAVALKYDRTKMMAPVLVAKGGDKVAARIRAVAEEHDVPLVSNPPLARALYDTVDIDEPITPEHYRAVAEVISYVYKMKAKK